VFSLRAVYANLRDVFINSLSARGCGNREDKERKKRSEEGKKRKARRNGGARSRRIIKCALPRKFIFILESITRKRRRARKKLPFSFLREKLSLSSRRSPSRNHYILYLPCTILLPHSSKNKPREYVVDYILKLTVTRLYIRNARWNV